MLFEWMLALVGLETVALATMAFKDSKVSGRKQATSIFQHFIKTVFSY